MTVIYVDTLFLLNAIIDYLLLLLVARLAGEPLRRLRFAAGAVLGGLYAVAIFLPGLGFLAHPLCKAASGLLMLLAAYGGSRRLLRQGILFVALTCALGGGVVAIGLLGGQGLALGTGVFYSALDLKMVLLSAAVCYAVLSLALRRIGRHTAASGRPVMVAEGESLAALFPWDHRPGPGDLRDPAGAVERLGTGHWRSRFRLLPYRCVGVECGLLLALRVDEARLGEQDVGPLLVALSPTPVSDGGGYRALVGPLDGKDGA